MKTTQHSTTPPALQSLSERLARRGALLLAATVGISLPFAMSGCNTTEGFGKDLEAVGDSISDEAEDANGD